jgi:hypothetical protein
VCRDHRYNDKTGGHNEHHDDRKIVIQVRLVHSVKKERKTAYLLKDRNIFGFSPLFFVSIKVPEIGNPDPF